MTTTPSTLRPPPPTQEPAPSRVARAVARLWPGRRSEPQAHDPLAAPFWKKVYVREELYVLSLEGDGVSTDEWEIIAVGFADLSARQAQWPEMLSAGRLELARRRLDEGDQVYLARGAHSAHLVWAGTWTEITTGPDDDSPCRIALDGPATVLHDCWSPTGAEPAEPRVLAAVARSVQWRHPETYVLTRRSGDALGAFTAAGLVREYELGRVRFLGRTLRAWAR